MCNFLTHMTLFWILHISCSCSTYSDHHMFKSAKFSDKWRQLNLTPNETKTKFRRRWSLKNNYQILENFVTHYRLSVSCIVLTLRCSSMRIDTKSQWDHTFSQKNSANDSTKRKPSPLVIYSKIVLWLCVSINERNETVLRAIERARAREKKRKRERERKRGRESNGAE